MRKLPEPEVSAELAEAQRFLAMWKSVTVKPMTTREVDFAKLVRKQAYEDGLRDGKQAFTDACTRFAEFCKNQDRVEVLRDLAAMLTASQKEQK